MPEIVLSTLNARYIHAAFGLRYLRANLGDLKEQSKILEFDIKQRPHDIAERLLAENPRIVGLGVYIWNTAPMLELVGILKQARPDLWVVLGGPEVSHEWEQQPLCQLADYVIAGEAEHSFARLCRQLLAGEPPPQKRLAAELPDIKSISLPYSLYTDEDLAHRVVYVEASRGCPFSCEFCLSSLDVAVRRFELEPFLKEMQGLLDRGATQFKFVDRTFNLQLDFSRRILQFFLERLRPGLFLHFEMISDRLPEELKTLIAAFPEGVLQFEVGVQTLHPEVEKHISRTQNHARMKENFRFLAEETAVHVHADLIVGLPGESLDSFARGFDALFQMGPQEIQVGVLKRLKGTPLVRHEAAFGLRFNPQPPFEVLQTSTMDFFAIQRLRRFARYYDVFANSGRFHSQKALVWARAPSPFAAFLEFSDWLSRVTGSTEGLSVLRQFECLFEYATSAKGLAPGDVAPLSLDDYRRGGRTDTPPFLKPWAKGAVAGVSSPGVRTLSRQARHLVGG